jgi:HEAT repeat protein
MGLGAAFLIAFMTCDMVGSRNRGGQLSQDSIEALVAELKSDRSDVREKARKALVAVGAQAVPALVRLLRDKDVVGSFREGAEGEGAWDAVNALTEIGAPAVLGLSGALGDNEAAVRAQAATALGNIGPAAAATVPSLVRALRDRDDWVRLSAANALGKMGPEARKAVPDLTTALVDSESHVRAWIALALGEIGPEAESAVPALKKALRDPDEQVRAAAATAIERITQARQ